MEFRLYLYVNNFLTYVYDPRTMIPAIQAFFKRFSPFTGCKVNVYKSECHPVNEAAPQMGQSDIPINQPFWV